MWYKSFYSCCWQRLIGFGLMLQILTNCGFSVEAVKNVSLLVDPPTVRRFEHATLRCFYDLQNAPLYSVKFYRGLREFYRFSPTEVPNKKIFAFPGINVDDSLSNASLVVIKHVGFGLSGNFSCEVTADAPSFSTATASTFMQVVELPAYPPALWTEHRRYEPGDVLKANCSSTPSRPKVDLTFTINNMVVGTIKEDIATTVDNLHSSRISLKLHLQSIHFAGSVLNPSLLLRCTSQIGNIYLETKEIELGTQQRDPIPARVTSSGAGEYSTGIITMGLILLHYLIIR